MKIFRRFKPVATVKSFFKDTKALLFLFILLINTPQLALASKQLTTCSVSCTPLIVGSTSATLSLSAQLQTQIPVGGAIVIQVPTVTALSTANPSCSINYGTTTSAFTCSVSALKLTIKINIALAAGTSIVVNFNGGFTTPTSSAETPSFSFQSYSSQTILTAATLLDFQTDSITLVVAPAQLQSATVTSTTSTQVGQSTHVTVSFKTKNIITAGGQIQIVFPVWNPEANPSQQLSMISTASAVSCSNVNGLSTSLSCSISASNSNTLTIINAFATNLAAGSTVSFSISSILNPISLAPVFLQLYTLIADGTGIIDELTSIQYSASTQTSIPLSTAAVTTNSFTVQEYSNVQLTFYNPVPLNQGFIINIFFPFEFSLDQNLNFVYGYGLFGSYNALQYTADSSQNSVQINNGGTSYKQAGLSGVLIFQAVQNPNYVIKTSDFQIYITDAQGYAIASLISGLSFTATPGAITNPSVKPASLFINSDLSMTISFTPPHSTSNLGQVQIALPSNVQTTCTIQSYSSSFTSTSTPVCSTSGNTFTFKNLYSSAGYNGNIPLSIVFSAVKLPISVQTVTGLSIGTYELVNTVPQLVDQYIYTSSVFVVQAGQFLKASVSPSTVYTSTAATFTFNFQLMNGVPTGGKFILILPSDVQFNTAQMSCQAITSMSSLTCAYSVSNSIGQILITGGAGSAGIVAQTSIAFSISGFTTPITTKTSNSFQFTSYDSASNMIDQTSQYLTVTMSKGIMISNLQASSSSIIVGSSSTHTLIFTSPCNIPAGSTIQITIPSQLTPPSSGLVCNGQGLLQYSQFCTISGQIVTVTPQFASTSASTLNQQMNIKIGSILNPSSTKPTGVYSMILYDPSGYLMAQTTTTSTMNAFIVMALPAQIQSYSFYAINMQQLATTNIIVSFINAHLIPSGGIVQIQTTPSEIIPAPGTFTCTSNIQSNPLCSYSSSGLIIVGGLFGQDYPAGSNVTLTFNHMELQITTAQPSQSWNLTTFTNDQYMVDRRDTGLNFTFMCTSPCQTCPANKPTTCLSCNPETSAVILYNGNCFTSCPAGSYFYSSTGNCLPCSTNCLTCSYYDGNICTACNPNSLVPYLNGNTCSNQCAFGFYGDITLKKCAQCQTPCASCTSASTTSCLSCDANSLNKYFYSGMCLQQCPSGYFIPTGSADYTCQQCDPNCKECTGTSTTCTSCSGSNILSLYNNVCVTTCQSQVTVYNPSINVCQICSASCATCAVTAATCTSCQQNLYLFGTAGTCVGDCSANGTMIGVNGVCVNCDSSCITCQNTPTQCLQCASSKVFYNYTCLSQCPTGYVPNSDKHCLLNGLRCPFGYGPNPLGDACILDVQICDKGFQLNLDKTRCIPEPGKYIPFPLCITCFFLSLIAVASKIKYKNTLLSSNIVAFISIIELVGMIAQVVQSYIIGLKSTFALTILALFFHFGSNIFFTVIYYKQVRQDAAFKYWAQNYHITQQVIVIVGLGCNFKFFRMLYSRFFNMDNFNGPFEDPDSFFKPFTFISAFSLVSTMLPLLVANIIGLVFIQYGYQVFINCLEMTIIEVVILALTIYEYILLKKHLIQQNTYYKIQPKLLGNSQANVMSSLMDDSSDQLKSFKIANKSQNSLQNPQSLSTQNTKEPVTYGEHFERRRLLEKLLNKLTGRNTGKKDDTTLALINELQEEEIMKGQYRNCRSYRDPREEDEDFADKDAGDPELQNFISAPTSPREKDMLHNPFFQGRLVDLKKAYRLRDQQDNVYAEAKPAHFFPFKDCRLVSVKVQVSPMDLLGIDEFSIRDARNKRVLEEDRYDEGYVEENIGRDYANGIISNVISGMDTEFKKRRRRLPKNRLKDIPNFELADIMGDFDIDDEGNHLIVNADSKLNDRVGNKVNRRGYLVDVEGNIVTKKGQIIFRSDEIDSDDEIPAPFCFEKKKESLFKIENLKDYKQKQKKVQVEDHDDDIEKEFKKLKNQNKSNRSSVDSLMGETPSKYNAKNRKKFESDDDSFLSKIVQPMQAKSKMELVRPKGSDSLRKKVATDVESQRTMDSRKGTMRNGNQAIKKSPTSNQEIQVRQASTTKDKQKKFSMQDTSANEETSSHHKHSAQDLFFSSLAKQQGVNRSRPHPFNFNFGGNGTQSTAKLNNTNEQFRLFNSSTDEANERFTNKYQKLKDVLGNTREDEILLRKLVNIENNVSNPSKKRTKLQAKNLAKVYGKVQDKYKSGKIATIQGGIERFV